MIDSGIRLERLLKRVSRRQWIISSAVSVGIIVLIVAAGLLIDRSNKREVPNFAGLTMSEASELAENTELTLAQTYEVSSLKELPDAFSAVDAQSPKPGSLVYANEVVEISLEGIDIRTGDYVGLDYSQAVKEAFTDGLIASSTAGGMSRPDWKVTEQSLKKGSSQHAGTELVFDLELPIVTVPDLTGMTEAEAKTTLEKLPLVFQGVIGEGDRVLSLDPSAGSQVSATSEIRVTFGYAVPDLTGLSGYDAKDKLQQGGFENSQFDWADASRKVSGQSPAPGSIATPDTVIQINLNKPVTTFRVLGDGGSATVTWVSPGSMSIQQEMNVGLPWEKNFNTLSMEANFNAQTRGGTFITCQVLVDGVVKLEKTSTGPYAVVSCLRF